MEFLLLVLCILVVGGWALYCNDRTFEDRNKIIRAISEQNLRCVMDRSLNYEGMLSENDRLWRLFKRVSYHDHLFTVLFFQDPYKLYDEKIRSLLTKN